MMLCVLLGLCCLYLIWKLKSSRTQSKEPPELPGKLPLIGHAYRFLGNGVDLFILIKRLSEVCLESAGPVKLYLGLQKMYFVADPEESLTILNTCLKKHHVYEFVKPWTTANGIMIADVPVWKKHRKLLNPAFNQQVLDGFIDVFNSQAQSLVDQFANKVGKSFCHYDIIQKNSLETIFLTAIGIDTEEYSNMKMEYLPQFEGMLSIITQRFQKTWLYNDFIYNMTSQKKKQDEYMKNLVTLSNSIIQKKKSEMKKTIALNERTPKNFKPFMDLILELSKDVDSFTDDLIRGETDTIIAAGHDTCANALTFCLTLLGSYPQVQEKAYNEIIQVLGNSTIVDKESLSRLVYIEAILKETLRVYPSVPIVGRHIDKDIKLSNYTLRANTGCLISIYGINRHKMWGPDANTFRPERWLEKETLPDPKYYAPFSLGRRGCIAKAYAMTSLKILLTKVLQNYRISSEASKMVLKIEIVLRTDSGHDILLERRNI